MSLTAPSRFLFVAAIGGVALSLQLAKAQAETASGVLNVTAQVRSGCAVTGATLAFDPYTGSTVNNDTSFTITCSTQTPVTVNLGPGGSGDSNNGSRSMTGPNPADKLLYVISEDRNHGNAWEFNEQVQKTVPGGTEGLSVDVFGRIPAGLTVPPGNYSDQVNITVTFN